MRHILMLASFLAASPWAIADQCDNLRNNQQAYRDCVYDWYGRSNRGSAPTPWWKGNIDQGKTQPSVTSPSYQENDPRLLNEIRAKYRADYEYHERQNRAAGEFKKNFADALLELEDLGNKREAVFLLEKAKQQKPFDQSLVELALANLDTVAKSSSQNLATLQPLLTRLTLTSEDINQLVQFRILLPVYLNFWSRIGFERYPEKFKYIYPFSYIADACTNEQFYAHSFNVINHYSNECLQQRHYKGLLLMERYLDASPRDHFMYILTLRGIYEARYGGKVKQYENNQPNDQEKLLTKRIEKYERLIGTRFDRIQPLLAARAARDSWDVRMAPLYFEHNWQGVDFRNANQVIARLEQLLEAMPKLVNYSPKYDPLFSSQNSIGVIYKGPKANENSSTPIRPAFGNGAIHPYWMVKAQPGMDKEDIQLMFYKPYRIDKITMSSDDAICGVKGTEVERWAYEVKSRSYDGLPVNILFKGELVCAITH